MIAKLFNESLENYIKKKTNQNKKRNERVDEMKYAVKQVVC